MTAAGKRRLGRRAYPGPHSKRAARRAALSRGAGRRRLAGGDALLRELANLFEALGHALVEDIEGLGIGLGQELGQLAGVRETLLERLLRILRLLGEPVLGGRARLHEIAEHR